MSFNGPLLPIAAQLAEAWIRRSDDALDPAAVLKGFAAIYEGLVALGAGQPADTTKIAKELNADKPRPQGTEARELTTEEILGSVQRDYLVSFEDEGHYKSLRPHLRSYGLTFEEYKAKWGLPKSYPATAPALSEAASQRARATRLGRRKDFKKVRGNW